MITRGLRDHGLQYERLAFVVKDVFGQFRYVYPSDTKSVEQYNEDSLHFYAKDDKIGVAYSDNAPELAAAVRDLKTQCIPGVHRRVEGGQHSGFHDSPWLLAAQHRAVALNLTKRLDTGEIPWDTYSFRGVLFRVLSFLWELRLPKPSTLNP